MPKRANETKEERKLRKIQKLERKIEKYKAFSSSSDLEDPEVISAGENALLEEDDPQQDKENVDLPQDQENVVQELQEEPEDKQEVLPQDILAALGQGEKDKDLYGEEINSEIIKLISVILTDGLDKEAHDNLSKASKIPKNAKLLEAPKLNNELSGLLTNSMSHRDNMLKDRQQDLGQGIALVTQTINILTKKDFDKIEVIKTLSDSVRLLSNLHHQYTQIRRKLIAPVLDKSLSKNLNDNKRSEFLYSQLEESVKTSSAIKRTISILKPKNVSKNYQHPRRQSNQAQYHQTKNMANNTNYKSGTYQNGQGQTYKPHHRNHPQFRDSNNVCHKSYLNL